MSALADPRAAAAEHVAIALAICEPANLDLAVILLRDALDVLTDPDPYNLDELYPQATNRPCGEAPCPPRAAQDARARSHCSFPPYPEES